MAENIKENDKLLAGFKRRYRKAGGISRLKRGADIPLAVHSGVEGDFTEATGRTGARDKPAAKNLCIDESEITASWR